MITSPESFNMMRDILLRAVRNRDSTRQPSNTTEVVRDAEVIAIHVDPPTDNTHTPIDMKEP